MMVNVLRCQSVTHQLGTDKSAVVTAMPKHGSIILYRLASAETRRLVRMDSPGRPPRLSHSS